jgi:hypothetical protein
MIIPVLSPVILKIGGTKETPGDVPVLAAPQPNAP